MGEFGSLVIITGNLPYKTEVSSVYIFGRIESGDQAGAAAVAVVLLAISFAVLLAIGVDPALHDEARPWLAPSAGSGCVRLRSAYLAAILVGPLAVVFYRTFEHGFAPPGRRSRRPRRSTPSS